MSKFEIRSAYSPRQPVSNPAPDPSEPSRVKSEFKNEVNINTIVRKMRNGQNPPSWMTSATPRYGDFTSGPQSLMEAFDIVQRAEIAFSSLPLEFRRAIDHDPARITSAPRELWEQFGLLKKAPASDAPEGSKKAEAPAGGQRVPKPSKAPQGAKQESQDSDTD